MVRAVYFYNSDKQLIKSGSLTYDSGTDKYTFVDEEAVINQSDIGVTQIVIALPSGKYSNGFPLLTYRRQDGYLSTMLQMTADNWTIIEDEVETEYQIFYIDMDVVGWTYANGQPAFIVSYMTNDSFDNLDLAFYVVSDGVNLYEEITIDYYQEVYLALIKAIEQGQSTGVYIQDTKPQFLTPQDLWIDTSNSKE